MIDAEKAKFPIQLMCRCFEVSPSGYYAWRKREPSPRACEEEALLDVITDIFNDSHRTWGSPRVHAELLERGIEVGLNRVARIMSENRLFARQRPKFRKTTDSDHDMPVAANDLDRNFEAAEPDRVWVADITYVWTLEGWMYLAAVIDLFSRRVIGWAMADHMRTELVLDALEAALGSRAPSNAGLLHHSDRGSQLELNGSSQHSFVEPSVDDRRALHQVFSRRGSCAAGY